MIKTKQPTFDGKFYPKDTIELESKISQMIKSNPHFYDYSSRALIVPHAGYFYSGEVAANTYQYLDKNIKNIFIFAPAHYVDFKGIAISTAEKFATPLGQVEVNQKINEELAKIEDINFLDAAFEKEHSIEVQIPFIQTVLPNAKIVPIVYNDCEAKEISQIIEEYYSDEENGFIISTDLSHFYPKSEAVKIDEYTANMIETLDTKNFHPAQACGNCGILGITDFAKNKEYSLIRVALTNSAEKTRDDASVVGYGGWFLAQEPKNTFLKANFSKLLIQIAKETIKSGIETGEVKKFNTEKLPPVLKESGACFVTLNIEGELRGCIGSVSAHRSLIDDLNNNAFSAAFDDSRFMPLTSDEFEDLTVSISLLSDPVEMNFKNEKELLNSIVPDKDGIIIQDGVNGAVYLPSVWEQLPEKVQFLGSLKQKAGLAKNHFSKSFRAYRFSTEYIQEI